MNDLDQLASAIERAFPDIGPIRPLSVLGRGFRSLAVETAGGCVVRVGLIADASDDYAKEWRIGPFLARALAGIVPEPRSYAEPCGAFPHGALGYRKLAGETPAWGLDPGEAFARDLGAFMARLHRLPLEGARTADVPVVDSYQRLLGARDVVMPLLAARVDASTLKRIEEWWSGLAADERMRTERVAACHHDLWHDNLLRSPEGRLSGVLDMAHVEIGDPAHDFAAPRYFGDAFMEDLMSAYRDAGGQFDADDAYRAERFYEGREFGGLAWAIEHDDAAEIDDSVRKIVERPLFAR